MKKLFLAGMLGLVCMMPLQAQTKAEADSAYAAGKYEDAISVYTALLKKGESADVWDRRVRFARAGPGRRAAHRAGHDGAHRLVLCREEPLLDEL